MTKVLKDAAAFGLALELGCVISVWSGSLDCELSRGYPRGADDREPDLKVTPILCEDGGALRPMGLAYCEALTPDGEAFLALAG
jgi:hypothetical protein